MNPGGDYGKKELSPALRNRFTEIWVPPVCELNELKCIALDKYVIFLTQFTTLKLNNKCLMHVIFLQDLKS